jgi:hypothetical protein
MGAGATLEVVGSYTNWPTTWIPLNNLNDPNDGLGKSQLDFVGDSTNSVGFYASTNGYVFFRQRLKINSANRGQFNDSHFVLINLVGTNYGYTSTTDDGFPDYAFAWDSFNNVKASDHGLEMQVRGFGNPTWAESYMSDIDTNSDIKGTFDINGNSRTTDGYLRVISDQNTTNFGLTTFIDYAVKWSYLQTYTTLNSNQTWKVTFASLDNGNDHSVIANGDITGGINPSSPTTNGWMLLYSTLTGSEPPHQGTFFSFAMISIDDQWMHLAQNSKKGFCSYNDPAKRKEDLAIRQKTCPAKHDQG